MLALKSYLRGFIFLRVALVEFGACARHFHEKFVGIIRYNDTSRFRVVPWNTTDLTGRINTAGRVLSVTVGKKRARVV